MKPNPFHRLPAPLEEAVQRVKLAARESAERTIETLGLAALASTHAFQRDGLLAAQFELNRKSAVFALTFSEAFDERVLRELGPRAAASEAESGTSAAPGVQAPRLTSWDALSLVEDKEVEAQISAERFGLEVAHACEWELRDLEGFVAALLGEAGGERDRNPLRPDLVGHAMIRGIEAVSDRADVRKLLAAELSRALGGLLREAYAQILADMRGAGVQPVAMAVRNPPSRGRSGAGALGPAGGEDAADDSGHGGSSFGGLGRGGADPRAMGRSGAPSAYGRSVHGVDSRYGTRRAPNTGFSNSVMGGASAGRSGTPLGQVDPALMSLIRRLAASSLGGGAGDRFGGSGDSGSADYENSGAGLLLPNLIRDHRDELRQASNGTLDHMVIDVIGFLFDQILADPKLPPQMARQIARLQLPVLRAALGDPSFFSSRRHPVRRFVNRIASLGSAFEDFADEGARTFLGKVRALIQEVVEGDFDKLEIYEQKLAALEAFSAEIAGAGVNSGAGPDNAATLLADKEDQQRLSQLYAQRMAGDLKDLAAPEFLREFISKVWSQVLLRAAENGGPDGPLASRLRLVGRELFLSAQPKATPVQRKNFLAELPKLMQSLNEGMNLIDWPEPQRRAFFGKLMPAHAEALKSTGATSVLDLNLMSRRVEGALQRPAPARAELKTAPVLPVQTDDPVPQFSADEVQRVGLVAESAVDWSAKVEIGAALTEPALEPGPLVPGLPSMSEPDEPTEGRGLAEHLQVGFAYNMNLDGAWHKVRLAHVSAARSFFIFTHGARQRKMVSLTQRMLLRLCEAGRLRAFESAYLIERATARAQRQLAAIQRPQAAG
jgi:hypothetical protein